MRIPGDERRTQVMPPADEQPTRTGRAEPPDGDQLSFDD
jgi:hypothetical protein